MSLLTHARVHLTEWGAVGSRWGPHCEALWDGKQARHCAIPLHSSPPSSPSPDTALTLVFGRTVVFVSETELPILFVDMVYRG